MTAIITTNTKRLYTGTDWNFQTLRDCYDAIEEIAVGELGLETYPNRIEIITSEQMLDVYTSHGMPLIYPHWSFGKRFIGHENAYRRGLMGLAYEVVINSSPCISYLMEENTVTMQALVIAHAAFGHNHFFRNNRLFREWTDPSQILDYLEFARGYIARCEQEHGVRAVERILDAAHALQGQGVNRHSGMRRVDLNAERERARERRQHEDRTFNDLWRTLPEREEAAPLRGGGDRAESGLGLPEENILYFLEKHAPKLAPWEREIIRIVRLIAQYFYPQPQVKMMNEGCATWVHDTIMRRLHETGRIDDAAFLETIHSTSNVIAQFDFEQVGPNFNPYALGFAMMTDIARICTDPTDEDREWFPDIAGNGDPLGTLRYAWAEFRDESFIQQYLSPAVMRRYRMFRLLDDSTKPYLLVDAIHNEDGYRAIRRSLASTYDPGLQAEEIDVVGADLAGTRTLRLEHRTRPGQLLQPDDARRTLAHLADLWGYGVVLKEIDTQTDRVLFTHSAP
ncbi:putative stage V sporulation protein R [Ameyamaea chiangmaiensis NBRC 103196]|uniref:SpoVR family protein n=1 Tax=Ameyamaea chiangmaiensis TaxID=442969 RepID=A0A850P7Y6_9PROT|nr:SpoVR family protein [Ameyamaea chiangmaiensis]MBS4073605.1 SpoVR family protein [Ameyamaea chiangmaiensis]NVN40054.1 SpoVR family protein [Ameyamaea chiangmaiensis]GBQ69104.1 putative stage V sporulation protein R [Ameyamaea chiangmaiensis NBRC 103196]